MSTKYLSYFLRMRVNAGCLIAMLQLTSYKLFYFAWFLIMPTFLSYYNKSVMHVLIHVYSIKARIITHFKYVPLLPLPS